MEKNILVALAVIGAILFFGLVAPQPQEAQQQSQLIDSGMFLVEQAGRKSIEEQYTLFFSPSDGYMLLSQATMSAGEQNITLAQQYEFDRNFLPILYHLAAETTSGSQIISAQMGLTGLHMETRVGTAHQQADVEGEKIVILDNNLISHYVVLLLGLQAGAIPSQLKAAVPQALLSLPAKVDDPEPVTFASGNNNYQGRAYHIHLGDLLMVMITYQGKLVGVINDAQEVRAYNMQVFPEGIAVSTEPITKATTEGFVEEEVSFQSGELALSGTVTLPSSSDKPVPAVLFIPGSGPIDRDENTAGFKTNVFSQIAQALARKGVGSLRYDKRGVGKSEGLFTKTSMEEMIRDANAALDKLRAEEQIDAQYLFILGHSEGGILAPMIATENNQIAGLVLLAAPAHSLDWIIRYQIERLNRDAGKSEDEVQEVLAQEDQYLDFIRNSSGNWSDYSFEQLLESMPWLTRAKQTELTILPLSWLRQHFTHDPIEAIKNVTCPVLILQGDKDYQVPPSEAELLASALQEAGNEDVVIDVISNLNHLMRLHPEEPNLTYRHLNEPVDQRVLDTVTGWITGHVAQ